MLGGFLNLLKALRTCRKVIEMGVPEAISIAERQAVPITDANASCTTVVALGLGYPFPNTIGLAGLRVHKTKAATPY